MDLFRENLFVEDWLDVGLNVVTVTFCKKDFLETVMESCSHVSLDFTSALDFLNLDVTDITVGDVLDMLVVMSSKLGVKFGRAEGLVTRFVRLVVESTYV